MEDTQEQDPVKIKRSTYNKEGYEANKERYEANKEGYEANKDYILKYRKDRYASLNKKQYNIKVRAGEFVLNFN